MEEKSKNQQIIIKICCVIASFILWLYIFNVENPIRDRKITVPVQIVNKDILAQSKLVPIGEENLSITLDIRGNASDIYSVKVEDFKLESDLSAYVVKKGENKIPVEIKKSPQSIRIANNENLWVKIDLDELKQKVVSIKVVLEGKAREGFYAMQPTMNYKEVKITGPEASINSVSHVVARCNIKDFYKDINIGVPLQPEDSSGAVVKNVSVKPDLVQIGVPIKKIKSVPVNIKTQGKLENSGILKSIVSTPEKIEIAGEEKVLTNINALDTESIDLNKLAGKDVVEVKVIVPSGINLVNSNGIVKAKIDFDKGIQKQLNLNIQTRNIGNNFTATLEKDKTSVTVSGSESVINNLKAEELACYVDLSNLTEGEHEVPVKVNFPAGVSKIDQSITSVKVTIKKTIGG